MASLQKLEDAGIDLGKMPEAQKQVLSELSEDEVSTLVSVKRRLDATGGDVTGLVMAEDKGVFYF